MAWPYMLRTGRGKHCSTTCSDFARTGVYPLTASERFWPKVDKDGPILHADLGPCWIWTGATDPNGYGRFRFNRQTRLAHVVAYILTTGHEPPTETPCILHHCDGGTIGCVRPSHLYAGTKLDNGHDATARGRSARGSVNGHAKLTERSVLDIRARYATGEVTQTELSREYNVNRTLITQIIGRKRWKHI